MLNCHLFVLSSKGKTKQMCGGGGRRGGAGEEIVVVYQVSLICHVIITDDVIESVKIN